eukprot:CAMPEP_0172809960 /NCGR_PEP_ID=MMETSP1075-20121228/8509_1 /TAXON_ID=2916 /ORGANISM="Ceratium fusus, Strain PA161109" /LENGTH=61 /DNA_ID=CAMNT_0013649207 /DNA_START=35 /DNA_END=217 /DNA_ORIENTATION=+
MTHNDQAVPEEKGTAYCLPVLFSGGDSATDITSRSKMSPLMSVCTQQFTRSGVAVDAESLM